MLTEKYSFIISYTTTGCRDIIKQTAIRKCGPVQGKEDSYKQQRNNTIFNKHKTTSATTFMFQ
jgi:hypothetical protein